MDLIPSESNQNIVAYEIHSKAIVIDFEKENLEDEFMEDHTIEEGSNLIGNVPEFNNKHSYLSNKQLPNSYTNKNFNESH